jgi:Exostosin family
MSKALSNQYYLYIHRGQEPIPWNPPDPHPLDWVNYSYFGKVFEEMEKSLKMDDLVFYLTWDNVDELPSYGPNVVSIIIGDEWCRKPMYCHKVLAIFKCYGTRPILGCNPFFHPSYLNLLTLVQFLKNCLHRLPGEINYLLHKLKYLWGFSKKIAPIYDLPLGYDRQSSLPTKDIENRQYDIFFAGSVVHGIHPTWSLKAWINNPKTLSRKIMISNIDKIKRNYQDLKIELSITSSFGSSSKDALDEKGYSEKMMNSKICLVPRGTSFETFRFFEAMRYGCIVVAEVLPSRWFYNGSPAIQINNWSELEIILPRLLENSSLMTEIYQASLDWWKTKCSEAVVGNYMTEKLNSLANLS